MKFRALTQDDVEVRVGMINSNGVSLLLYKDARVDQNILDQTVGPDNWQKRYEVISGNLFCSVGIRVLHDDSQEREWIWKQDVGTESNTEKEKGQASDAFKRACFCWGIGRELYTAPFIWIPQNLVTIEDGKCKDRFRVKHMIVKEGIITDLIIVNQNGGQVFKSGIYTERKVAEMAKRTPDPAEPKPILLDEEQKKMLAAEMVRTGVTGEQICAAYHLTDLKSMTVGIYTKCMKRFRATKTKEKAG